jgi:DHA2 family multidrug resistance protein-like MFS transporter
VAGLLFTLTPLGTTVAAPLAGRVSDRSGPRWPVAVGLGLEAAGLLVLGSAHRGTPPMELAFALFVAGFGVGFFQVPNMAAIMAGFPPTRQGMAGGLAFLARTLGVVAGVLALATFFAWRRTEVGFDAAYAEAFLAAALAVGVASALAVLAPPPRRVPSAR